MRYMMIMQVEPEAAARAAEDLDMEQVVAAMGAYNEDLQKAGVFLTAEGLSDASDGFRVDFSSTPPVVTDGPYAEAREVFTGFWIIEVANREEAEHWAKKCPLGPGVGLEVRRVNEFTDIDLPDDNEWLAEGTGVARRPIVTSGRVGSHRGIPDAVRARVSEQSPDGASSAAGSPARSGAARGNAGRHSGAPRRWRRCSRRGASGRRARRRWAGPP